MRRRKVKFEKLISNFSPKYLRTPAEEEGKEMRFRLRSLIFFSKSLITPAEAEDEIIRLFRSIQKSFDQFFL